APGGYGVRRASSGTSRRTAGASRCPAVAACDSLPARPHDWSASSAARPPTVPRPETARWSSRGFTGDRALSDQGHPGTDRCRMAPDLRSGDVEPGGRLFPARVARTLSRDVLAARRAGRLAALRFRLFA